MLLNELLNFSMCAKSSVEFASKLGLLVRPIKYSFGDPKNIFLAKTKNNKNNIKQM
jgi:hypothetical protein